MNSSRTFDGVRVTAALVFFASAAVTAAWCGSMSHMPGMDMPGGWVMSMAWMRMPGQSWADAAGTFVAMWAVMMTAMMMPVFAPALIRYRRSLGAQRLGMASWTFASGYFGVWIVSGAALFPLGIAFAEAAMRSESLSRATPMIGGLVVMLAGASQFTRWKLRRLAHCRHDDETTDDCCARRPMDRMPLPAGARLGAHCVYCCAPLNAVLLVIGVMDLLAMALVTVAISAERLMAAGAGVARVVGAVMLAGGGLLVARTL